MIKVFGDEMPLKANVEVINGYSAHADRGELASWLQAVQESSPALRDVYLVHGEPPAQEELATSLTAKGFTVSSPAPGTTIML